MTISYQKNKNYNRTIMYVLFCSCIYLVVFHKAIEQIFFNGSSTVINEICSLLLLLISFTYSKSKLLINRSLIHLGLIFLYLFIVSVLFGKNDSVALISAQIFIHMQLFIVFLSILIIKNKYRFKIYPIFKIIIIISAIGLLMQLIIPGIFNSIFPIEENTSYGFENDEQRFWGFQLNSNALGILFSFFFITVLDKLNFKKNKLLLFFLLFAIIISGSRTALIFVAIGFIFSNFSLIKKTTSISLIVFILLFSGLSDSLIQKTNKNLDSLSTIDSTRYIRFLMTYHGVNLSIKYFPFGTGAATFGTVLSNNSSVYNEVGIADLPSVIEKSGIYDSNFGSISGEFGIIGLLIFYGFFYILIEKFKSYHNYKNFNIYLFFIIGIIASLLRVFFISTFYSVVFCLLLFSYIELKQLQNVKK
tara:strand:- start:9153 stop:10406 length:1254 start_codon:yes stop_codon:yes gene_type:complete